MLYAFSEQGTFECFLSGFLSNCPVLFYPFIYNTKYRQFPLFSPVFQRMFQFMSRASPQPRPSAVKIASNSASMAGNLAKGLVPLFRSGVLGVINPLALPKVGQGIAQWRFLPTLSLIHI